MAWLSDHEVGTQCVRAALAVSVLHILMILGTDYQVLALLDERQMQINRFFYFFDINHALFLSPVVVLFLARRVCILVGIFAIPVLIFFALRMHHVWEFYWLGINSMARQKGDELGWFEVMFDLFAAIIAVPWLLGLLLWRMNDRLARIWR